MRATDAPSASDFKLMTEQNTNDPPLEQVEFDINEINSEVAQNTVRDAVKDLNGVRDVQFVGGGAIVTYNPLGITREEICTAIRRSGYRATEIETAG
jgi:copper chaperone CopZ